jgi:hypothetical protein
MRSLNAHRVKKTYLTKHWITSLKFADYNVQPAFWHPVLRITTPGNSWHEFEQTFGDAEDACSCNIILTVTTQDKAHLHFQQKAVFTVSCLSDRRQINFFFPRPLYLEDKTCLAFMQARVYQGQYSDQWRYGFTAVQLQPCCAEFSSFQRPSLWFYPSHWPWYFLQTENHCSKGKKVKLSLCFIF